MPEPVPNSPPPSVVTPDDTSVRNAGDTSGEQHTVSQTDHPKYPFLGPVAVPGHLGTLGKYRVLGELGAGGMGFVFRGDDPKLNRAVALKVMRPEFVSRPLAAERFLREARSVAAVTHPHVVVIFDYGDHNGLPFLAMELLAGNTLEGWLHDNGGTAQPDAAVRMAKDTLAGLAAVHAHGLVHRDIKPSNLWVCTEGSGVRGEGSESRSSDPSPLTPRPFSRVKVLDFGLTRGTDSELTHSGAVVGTPAYMSPEQAGGKPVDARSDLFSVGTVLYRMLTGGNPFARAEPFATALAVVTDEPLALANAAPWVPERLARFVHRLLSKNPKGRFADAREALAELESIEDRLNAVEEVPTPPVLVADALPAKPQLIGRDNLLSLVGNQLKAGGVVVLRGEGGMGKTALAAAVAHDIRGPGGAGWVNCERTPRFEECVRQAAAALLGDRCDADAPDAVAAKVAAHLTAKSGLLVLDNFESVGGDPAFVRWVSGLRSPAQVLVTTRETPIGLHGRVIPVHELSREAAADLFRTRAAEAGLSAPPPADVVNALCERVGDQPLAIELLAVRAASRPAKRLLERVRENLAAIDAEDDPNRPARHRGVRACFAESFADLSPGARELLLNLSVLPASFGLDVLSAVAARDDWDDAADVLVRASLWRLSAERYAVHPLVRQLASDELGPNREQAECTAAQRVAALALAKRKDLRAAGTDRERTKAYLNWCGAELPNLVAVADAAFGRGDWAAVTTLGEALSAFWSARGYWAVADRFYEQATAAAVSAGDPVAEAWSREYQGFVCRHLGRFSDGEAAYLAALAVCDAHPTAAAAHRGRVLARFGKLLSVVGRYQEAIGRLEQALDLFQRDDNADGWMMTCTYLGQVYKFIRDFPRSEELFRHTLDRARRKGDAHRECESLFQLGSTYLNMNRLDDAERCLRDSQRLAKLAEDRIRESQTTVGLGIAATRRGQWDEAERLLNVGLQITRDLNLRLYEGRTLRRMAELWVARGMLDRARECARASLTILESSEDRRAQERARETLRGIDDIAAGRATELPPDRDDTR